MKVIYFDGVCGLCNGFVDFVIRHDRREAFSFSPLQSDYARANLPSQFTQDLKTIVVQIDGKIYKKSEAVLKVLATMGPPWSFVGIFKLLPASVADAAYDMVAENRYRIFGKKESCRLPSPEERRRFIL